ncbi:DUF732 domain-containing protein [Lentzea sp. NPDC058436]|uniref:DUF732 domain-containing protein n=1 Tax=Lentzea sp. NPDC058436 TaxID=3346499 RepID=UPI0036551FA4
MSAPPASEPSTSSIAAPTTSSTQVTTSRGESARPIDRRAKHLAALSATGVPASVSGDSEVLTAQGMCNELVGGAAPEKPVDDLVRVDGVMTSDRAEAMPAAAEQAYR